MTVLDLELPEAIRSRAEAIFAEGAEEWTTSDVPEGTAERTLRAALGSGLDRLAIDGEGPAAFVEVLMGLATVFPAAAVVLTMHGAVLHLATSSGTESQRARVLKDGILWGFGAAPPAEGPRAQVARSADGAVLSGSLRRVSGAGIAGGLAVLVPYGDKSALLLLESDRQGVAAGTSWAGSGLRASSTRQVSFDGVNVDRDDVVTLVSSADERPSWETAMLGLLAVCAGIARRAATIAIERLRDPRAGAAVRRNSRSAIAQVLEEATAAMAVTRAAAARARRGPVDRVRVLGSKMATAAMAERAVAAARLVVGMDGFEAPHPLERLSRDALGVRHFFPVDPIALDAMLEEVAPEEAVKDRAAGGSPGRQK
ncbi:MAG: acyl-CoA/acyl-ACP dehydrogenase [Polyangiaceae bacterium]|nr:acyl-CoA/acyl-ACP dehydrogenase [Polyangiaceae bacterium]